MTQNNKSLCVDCDGTLIATDLLYEGFFLMLKQYPMGLLLLPFWLLKGKAYLKNRIAEKVEFNWSTLPYREDVVQLVTQARTQGRTTVLATASPQIWADGIAQQLGCFDLAIGTSESVNLSGHHKADHLAKLYGEKGFEYAGDGQIDMQVWTRSAGAIVVSNNHSLLNQLTKQAVPVVTQIKPKRANLLVYIKALRVHQWLKNLLILVPLLAAHQLTSVQGLLQAGYAFIAFSLCASAVYVLNDLLDLESDRQHIRKRKRPFAACTIPLSQGMLMVPVLLAIAFAVAYLLPIQFVIVLFAYFMMTLAYSFRLKKQVIVDVMMLAGLYTMRIIAGAAATAITPSFWLLAFSMFIFLSLAMVKRYSELLITLQANKKEPAGRGYSVEDLPVLMAIGVSAGLGSVLILALYINSPETNQMYPNTMWLWLIPPIILYWTSRMWMKAHRGQVDDDPVVFAARDWQSLTVIALSACIFAAALFA
ncbi:MAG: UbiA family prenyltransferase [Methylophilus sp.]|nr:UbiA family prenyltransferase [Methylophilus sp.]